MHKKSLNDSCIYSPYRYLDSVRIHNRTSLHSVAVVHPSHSKGPCFSEVPGPVSWYKVKQQLIDLGGNLGICHLAAEPRCGQYILCNISLAASYPCGWLALIASTRRGRGSESDAWQVITIGYQPVPCESSRKVRRLSAYGVAWKEEKRVCSYRRTM